MRDIYERLARIEQFMDDMAVMAKNQMFRGTVETSDDSTGMQQHTVNGLYGEKLEKIQRWEQFGHTSVPPAGSDALLATMNGNRDSTQMIAAKSPGSRPQNMPAGSSTLYDNSGSSFHLDGSGNGVLTLSGGLTIKAGGDVKIESATLTHNGKNIGFDHKHTDVVSGGDITGVPV